MYVCLCKGVTERDIESAVQNGATRLADLARTLGVATCCGQCGSCAADLLKSTRQQASPDMGQAA
ncbi:MAG: hypothetical protein Kow006_22700 [Gammaproteobacteria bacterium]